MKRGKSLFIQDLPRYHKFMFFEVYSSTAACAAPKWNWKSIGYTLSLNWFCTIFVQTTHFIRKTCRERRLPIFLLFDSGLRRPQRVLSISMLYAFSEHTLYIICTYRMIGMWNERMSLHSIRRAFIVQSYSFFSEHSHTFNTFNMKNVITPI